MSVEWEPPYDGAPNQVRATRKSVGTLAFSKLAKNPMKNEIIELLGLDEFDEFIENLAEVGVDVS